MSVFLWAPKGRSPKWVAQWVEDGKKRRLYFSTEEEAQNAERNHRLSSQEQRHLTVAELVATYLRHNPHKHENYKRVMVYFLYGSDKNGKHKEGAGEFLRNKYAEHLTRFDLEHMRENVRANGSGNNAINKYQAYLRGILSWGADQELISHNPWREIKKLPVSRHIVTTTISDIRIAYPFAPAWLQWAMKTVYALSLRPGKVELFGLLWTSFNWRRGCVSVRQGKSGHIKTVFPPKTYMDEAKKRYDEDMASGIPWVCHRNSKRVLSYSDAWKKTLEDAGLPHFPMYHIRHAAATEMLAAGADPASVAAQLGHSTVTTTCTVYAHVTSGGQQRAAALMPGIDDE